MSSSNLTEYTDKELMTIYENLQKQMARVGAEIKRRKAKKAKVAAAEESSPGVLSSLLSLVTGGSEEKPAKATFLAPRRAEGCRESSTRVTIKAAKATKATKAAVAASSSDEEEESKPVRVTMAHLKAAYKKKTGDNPPSSLSKDELEEEVRKVGALRMAKQIAVKATSA
jgi:hypothetical protein